MIVAKNKKYYTVTELDDSWSVILDYGGGFTVECSVSKDIAKTYEELEDYLVENETLFI